MKILQLLPYFPPHTGGVEQVASMISKYFVKGNYGEVMNLVFSVGQEKESGIYRKDGATIVILPAFDLVYSFPFPKLWKKSFWQGIKKAKEFNPDIIQTHTRFFLSTFLGGILAKKWKKKWIHVEHGGGFVDDIAWWKKTFAWLYDQTLGRLVFFGCDKIISINQANVSFISKFCKKEKIRVIYNGIEFPEIAITKKKRTIPAFVFVGRLAIGKGVHILLEAVKNLKTEGISNFSLSIIGDGEERTNLEMYVKDNELKNVKFLGKKSHDEVVEFLVEEVDILVNPSFREGLPTTVLEGLLAKCVVVATNVGGTKEISDQDDLVLIPVKNGEKLKEVLTHTFRSYSFLQGLSYESVKEKFSWEKNVEKYIEVYRKF